MKGIIASFQKNLLIWVMFLTLFFFLFLGDGKQEIIDVVGLGLTLVLFIIARFFFPKQREIPRLQTTAWLMFLVYLTVRSVFSDDIGYSVFVTLRYYEAFTLYYIFSCYFTEKHNVVFNRFLLGFGVISLMSALATTFIPDVAQNLPLMNLLFSTYGHNHVVDIILFGFPLALIFWFQTKKPVYFWLITVFFTGTVFAFARAALLFEAVLLNIGIIYSQIHNKHVQIATMVIGLSFMGLASIASVFPYQIIQSSGLYLPKQIKQQDVFASRFEFTKQAIYAFKDRPLFGSGPGTFNLLSKRFQEGPEQYSWFAHNFIAETLAEIGFVGILLLGFVVFSIFTSPSSASMVPYGVLGAVFLYGLVDYSLNYLVVWFLFWSYFGLLKSNHPDKHVMPNRNPPFLVWFSTTCVFLGYLVLLAAFFVSWSPSKLLLVQKADEALQNNTDLAKYATLFHKRNPETLTVLSKSDFISEEKEKENILFTAISFDPYNTYLYNDLFQETASKGKYTQLWSLLQKTSCLIKAHSVCEKIQTITFSPELGVALKKTFDSSMLGFRNDYSAIYYYLGYYLFSVDPQSTKIMWELASLTRPDTGHYFIERASLERYIFDNESGVNEILILCQDNLSSKEECRQSVGKGLPEPGWFFESIKNYL